MTESGKWRDGGGPPSLPRDLMDPTAYRRLQDAAVTGNEGSAVLEVQLITSSIQVPRWLLSCRALTIP